MEYSSEEEFLKAYNPDEYEKLSMTTDIIIFSVSDVTQDNYRKTSEKVMSILMVKRNTYPYKGKWCVPGGFVGINEDLEDCPKRILKEETNLHDIYLEQLYTFGRVDRDPRMRIVSTGYMALIDKNNLKDRLSLGASWLNVSYEEKEDLVTLTLTNLDERIVVKARKELIDRTSERYKYHILENKDIAFDHAEVILTALERLRNKVEYTDIVFNMMPKYFTLGELQKVYEVILGKSLLMPAFRRIIANKVQKTDQIQGGGGHRPSYLFEYGKK